MGRRVRARVLHPAAGHGPALILSEPLSLWGGLDPRSGEIVEPRHPQRGASVAGRVVVMPAARGSSSSSSVLAEAARAGAAPAAILLGEPDAILAVGAAVAEELYGVQIPVVVLTAEELAGMTEGARVVVHPDGRVAVE
jgi:predicted aconitase with swiveling domain